MMIMETSVDSCRINFRSKGKFTVNDLAKYLGGGGQAYAAGAKVGTRLERHRGQNTLVWVVREDCVATRAIVACQPCASDILAAPAAAD